MQPPVYVGVDLGGTKIAAAIGSPDGRILARQKVDTAPQRGPEEILDHIAQLADGLSRESGVKPVAIGLGVPGLVDTATGITQFLPNLSTQWRGVAAADGLQRRSGLPAYILNDARVATLGELVFGAGRGSPNFLLVTVGTGIGGGLVLEGRLQLGPFGAAGEVGHQTILPDGAPCSCGSRGCLETLTSGPVLAAQGAALVEAGLSPVLSRLANGSAVTAKHVAQAARAGDPHSLQIIARAAAYLGIGVANVVTITGVDLVVLSGGLAALGDLLLDPIRAEVVARVRLSPGAKVRFLCSTLGDDAGALGGIALAAQRHANSL